MKEKLWKYRYIYLLMLPALALLFVFAYAPMSGIFMAFNDYKLGRGVAGIFTSPFVGLEHFKKLFSSFQFFSVLGNTLIINGLKLIFVFPAPVIFALLLNEVTHLRFKKLVQTFSYLPSFLSVVVVYGLTLAVLSPSYGLLNSLVTAFGGNPVHFLAEAKYFRSILVIIDMWRFTGWDAIIYFAAITSIDQEMYEAAILDGATKLHRMFYITLPCIADVIFLMFILRLGNILSADFEMVILLYNPTVRSVGDIIDTYVYREGLVNSQFSFATAVGLFKSAVGFLLIMVTNSIAKRFGRTGIW